LVIGRIAMNATQMLVIAIIMPTIVRDIGGARFYTWAAMLYRIGAIGGSSTAMVSSRPGPRCAIRSAPGPRTSIIRVKSTIAARAGEGWAWSISDGPNPRGL
jgi:hypothetical protein